MSRATLPVCYTILAEGHFHREGARLETMSDRGFLFLFSILMIVAGLGAAAWLFVTGQAGTVDGLFLLLTALLVALVFALYAVYAIRRAMEAAAPPAPQAAKAGAADSIAKTAPAAVSQS